MLMLPRVQLFPFVLLWIVLGTPATADVQVEAPEGFQAQAEALVEALGKLGVDARAAQGSTAGPVVFLQGAELAEGIAFSISSDGERVTVQAASTAGAALGAVELIKRAVIEEGEASWPAFQLEDGPDLEYRSFMVDMGRNPHSPAVLRQVVNMMWLYRGNYLHLHLTDDQLCSWPSKAFPKLKDERAGWTWEDYVELEAYSQARGITILPEIDVPAHSTLLRKHYPEVFGETVADLASTPEAQAGVETLIDELLSVFKATPYVHIGGDEAYGVPESVQRDFINRLNAFVKSRGRRTVVWEGPSGGTGEDRVDADVLHINWRTINFPAQEMLDAGHEVVNAAWHPMYIVDHYPRTMFTAVSVTECFEWEPRRFKHIWQGIPTFNEPHWTKSADGILGFCMPWWEGREENLIPLCWPRFAAVATAAWNLDRPGGLETFAEDYFGSLRRLERVAGVKRPQVPMADPDSQTDNLAYKCRVHPSAGRTQPHFSPRRLTNGITDPFDHYLGYPTHPKPLEIRIPLRKASTVDRIVVHETAVGESFEQYRVSVSLDGREFTTVGESREGTRGEASFVVHEFTAREVAYVRIVTDGCQNLTFPSFSRLVEVEVFGPPE